MSFLDLSPMVSLPETNEPFRPDFSEGVEIGVYLALLELIDEGLLIVSDERILEVNSAACRWLERNYRELIQAPLESLFPSPQAFLHARARWFIQNETKGSITLALPHGRKKVFRFTAAARIRPGMHAILIAPDLLHEQYRSTSLAETFWIQLAAASTEPIWVLDETERLVAVNAAARARWPAWQPLLHQPITEAVTVHWPEADEPPVALIEGIGRYPLRARILNGPNPGWRVLLFTPHRHPPRRYATDTVSASSKSAPGSHSITEQLAAATPEDFTLWLSPCVDVATGMLVGAEGVLRWHAPHRGSVDAETVAPLLLDPTANRAWLTAWLTHATRWARRWQTPLALNLDARQLRHRETLTQIKTAWRTASLPWSLLMLEIDETAFSALDTHQCAQLLEMGEKGVRIVVDHVGQGTSNFGLLAHLPVHAIKLAATWVTQIGRDERVEKLLDGLLQFGNAMGFTVIAEGVATAAQRDFLAALGCRFQQGPIFGPWQESTQPLTLKQTASPQASHRL
ncbi:sensor domain-containing phosphodiesterase [Hydrogenophilus thermoluteolus]|uniref:sensor domain-containing phosphodiesterase n=1 Tax=Hydrogenophilus thermoluteolus TaxID=297 RepID=UPI001473112B|nr:EAL domain-containing protein [Hydrogenophilus thermoluteolus]